jgi:hypothetical protein
MTAVVECASRAVVAAAMGLCSTGERTLAADLTGAVGPGMLLLADSGFYSFELFNAFAMRGADLAWRVGASVSIGLVRWLPDGSYLALIYKPGLSAERRRRLAQTVTDGGHVPADVARLVRVIDYAVPNRNPDGDLITVITTLLDPHEVPGVDLANAYHDRWEEESTPNEIKSDLRGRGEVLRSKPPYSSNNKPGGSCWRTTRSGPCSSTPQTRPATTPTGCPSSGAYDSCAARSPTRRLFPPERLVTALRDAHTEIVRHGVPERRPRSSPRAIKRARHNSYRVKRPTDRITRHPSPPTPLLARPNTLI